MADSASPHTPTKDSGDEREGTDAGSSPRVIVLPSVQEYWRTYASWLACWPGCAEARNDMARFAKEWEPLSKAKARCFVVVHTKALRLRSSATASLEECTGKYLRPGQCFIVTSSLDKEDATFLKLADGSGWVFDRVKGQRLALELDAVELGEWWYTITTQDFVEVRTAPSISEDCRSGWIMCPKEVTMVGLRCQVGGHLFLQLQDGRGWLFEKQPPAMAKEQKSVEVMRQCTAQHVEDMKDAKHLDIPDTPVGEASPRAFSQDLVPFAPNIMDDEEEEDDTGRGRCFGFCGRNPAVSP